MALDDEVQVLKQFGYGITETGVWDDATKKNYRGFQYHLDHKITMEK